MIRRDGSPFWGYGSSGEDVDLEAHTAVVPAVPGS